MKKLSILGFSVGAAAFLCIGWGSKPRSTDDLMKFEAMDASISIDASDKPIDDLVKLAAACANGKAVAFKELRLH